MSANLFRTMHEWVEEPDLRRTFDWFVSFIGSDSWQNRKAAAEAYLESLSNTSSKVPVRLHGDSIQHPKDRFGWYLFLAHTYLSSPMDYDHTQGSRVIPIFITIGRYIEYLLRVSGINERVERLVRVRNENPDSGLFELLVAAAYARNGWPEVAFLPEGRTAKTPDLRIKKPHVRARFVECKRLSMVSQYTLDERKRWLDMWPPLDEFFTYSGLPFLLEITFHVELRLLDNDVLERELIPKLKFVVSEGVIIDNDTWTVSVRLIDMDAIDEALEHNSYKVNSASLATLLSGQILGQDKGFTCVTAGGLRGNYFESIAFVAGVVWSCDAPRAIQIRARDIRDQLAGAMRQVPDGEQGIIHIGLETLDASLVERERYRRITETVLYFDTLGKKVDWIYVHLFGPSVPPDKNWAFDETVLPCHKRKRLRPPLRSYFLVVPDGDGLTENAGQTTVK